MAVSQLGAAGRGFDLRSPGGTSRPQNEPIRFTGNSGAGPPLQLFQSHDARILKQETAGETTERLVGATGVVALAHALGEQMAAPLSPAELTTKTVSPVALASLSTAIATKSPATAANAGKAAAASSLVCSWSQTSTDVQKNPLVGVRGAAALTYLSPEQRCQRGRSSDFKSPQRKHQSEPLPPVASTPLLQPGEGPATYEARPSQVFAMVEDGTEEKEQGCTSTPISTSGLERAAAAARREMSSATAAATRTLETKVQEVCGERGTISEATCTSSYTNVVDTREEKVAEAKEKTRKYSRDAINLGKVEASGAGAHVGHRTANVSVGLRPSLAMVPPASLPANETFRPVHSDGAGGTSSTAFGRLCVSESYPPTGEKDEEADTDKSAGTANEIWKRVMQENVQAGFDTKVTTRIAVASKGRREHRRKRESDGYDMCGDTTWLRSARPNMRVHKSIFTPDADAGGMSGIFL